MVLKKARHLLSFAAALAACGMLFTRCTVDEVERPAPRVDFLYEGSNPYSDTVTVVYASTVDITVYLFASAGLKSHSVSLDGSAVSDSSYEGIQERVCDTVELAMDVSGGNEADYVISVSVTDWQDQTTDKNLVIAYVPGGTVPVRPVVVSNPSSVQAIAGDTATFRVIASGTSLSYQWQKDNVDIPGATSISYTTPPVDSSDNGTRFRCIVRNSAGRDTSNAATLTVITPTAARVTDDPNDQTVYEGQGASFFVDVSGTGTISYQWQKNGSNIIDANDNSYAISVTELSDNGAKFRCIVSNSLGKDTSTAATLTVNAIVAPEITTHPQSDSIGVGETATFTVQASGTSPSYQWQKNGSNITNARSYYYITPVAVLGDNGNQYRCIVSNSVGKDTSDAAVLTVTLLPPVISSDPQNTAVSAGQRATFSVYASGSGLSYQWQMDSVDIDGAQDNSYTTPVTTNNDDGNTYRCIVSNSTGSDTSASATLTVAQLDPPEITADPRNDTVTAGENATFSITASGTSPSYQWQKNGTNIYGAQSRTYSTPATVMDDSGATFRCIASNGAGRDTSAAAVLIVLRPPVADIGDSYQGGIVFYVDSTGQHGLIAATSDQGSSVQWGCDGTAIGGTGSGLGTGQANTDAITEGCSTSGIAALLCSDLSSGGYTDWYLPSKDELDQLYDQKSAVGGFSGTAYWSSTENNGNTAALQFFDDGFQLDASKAATARVRAIRAF